MANYRLRIGHALPGNYTLVAESGTISLSGQAATLSRTTASAGLSPSPESTGFTAKILDTANGQAQSTQGGDVTTISQYKAKYAPWGIYASNGVTVGNPQYEILSEALTEGDVGTGVKARRTNFTASAEEHGNVIGWENESYSIAPGTSTLYTTGKIWIPSSFNLGGGNPHWKAFIWNRVGSGRLYLMFYSNNYMAIRIDEGGGFTRSFLTPGLGGNSPFSLRDREVQWTTSFQASTNTVRMWIKATGVTGGEAECTLDESYGTSGMFPGNAYAAYQENVTLYTDGVSGRYLYTWGHRMWHV